MADNGRRTLVMLRPLNTSCGRSGYARLEYKGALAEITVTVQGYGDGASRAGKRVYALLLGGAHAAVLGELTLDARGQGGMKSVVDAQNTAGRPLSEYGILATGEDDGAAFAIVAVGSIGKGAWVEYSKAEQALFALLHPEGEEAVTAEEEPIDEPPAAEEAATVDEPDAQPEDDPLPAEEPCPDEFLDEDTHIPVQDDVPAQESASTDLPDPRIYDIPAVEAGEAVLQRIERTSSLAVEREMQAKLPEILLRAFWPQSLWPLNDLFTRFPLFTQIDRQGEVYIRVPLENDRFDHCLIGARLDGNWVSAAGFLVPGSYAHPPAGYEEGEFIATRAGRGYWALWEKE